MNAMDESANSTTGGGPPPALSSDASIGEGERCIYFGSVHPMTEYEEIFDLARGAIDTARIVPEKECAFLTFVSADDAATFMQEHSGSERLVIHDRPVKLGWGKSQPMSPEVRTAVLEGATRSVFIGNVDAMASEVFLRAHMEYFGPIEHLRIMQEKKVAFVHFISISMAMRAIQALRQDQAFGRYKLNYGKDRCTMNLRKGSSHRPSGGGLYGGMGNFPLMQMPMGASAGLMNPMAMGGAMGAMTSGATRTVYLGNIDPETTHEDTLAVVKGGILDNIKIMKEKSCIFVSFINVEGAQAFHDYAKDTRLNLKGKEVRVGYGKHVPLAQDIAQAVQQGATRNVYFGHVEGANLTEETLRNDCSDFGSIESVHIIPAKKCAFASFYNISSAIKAVEELNKLPMYSQFRIHYGKDVCAQLPPRYKRQLLTQPGAGLVGNPSAYYPGSQVPFGSDVMPMRSSGFSAQNYSSSHPSSQPSQESKYSQYSAYDNAGSSYPAQDSQQGFYQPESRSGYGNAGASAAPSQANYQQQYPPTNQTDYYNNSSYNYK